MEVILFTGQGQNGVGENFLRDIESALHLNGLTPTTLSVDKIPGDEITQLVFDKTAQKKAFFIYTLNGRMPFKTSPKFVHLLDHPFDHKEIVKSIHKNAVFGHVDRTHRGQIEFGFNIKSPSIFMPHAGPPPISDPLKAKDRDIDFLYSGNIWTNPEPNSWIEKLPNDPLIRRVFKRASDQLIAEYGSAEAALVEACDQETSLLPLQMFFKLAEILNKCFESYVRTEALRKLKGLNVHYIGDAPSEIKAEFSDSFTFYGYTHYDVIIDLMKRTKIVLNMTPKFAHGSHERIWYAMAQNAVVMTTASSYMQESFEHNRDILYIPKDIYFEASELSDLLAQPNRLDEISSAAREIYENHHTWQHRLADLELIMKPLLDELGLVR